MNWGRANRFTCGLFVGLTICCAPAAPAVEPNALTIDNAGNGDGYVQIDEIPPEDLVGVTALASLVGLDPGAPMPVAKLLEGSKVYRRKLLGDRLIMLPDEETPSDPQAFGVKNASRVKGFDDRSVVDAQATRQDILRAYSVIRYADIDRDTYLSFAEIRDGRYGTYLSLWVPLDHDRDGRISIDELATYYVKFRNEDRYAEIRRDSTWTIDGVEVDAQQREDADRMMTKMDRNASGFLEGDEIPASWEVTWVEKVDLDRDRRISKREMYRARAMYDQLRSERRIAEHGTSQSDAQRMELADDLADYLIGRHSSGGRETRSMLRRDAGDFSDFGQEIQSADADGNGYITESELRPWLAARIASQADKQLSPQLPLWFATSDLDGDGQVSLSEFLQSCDADRIDEFTSLDANNDGFVQANESGVRQDDDKIRFHGQSPMVVPANQTEKAELFISQEFLIADIDVEFSIAKRKEDNVDLELIGPDESLCTLWNDSRRMPWASGRVFVHAIIDDEAPATKVRMPRPPIHRSFRPQSFGSKTLESLDVFYGKPARGRWVLVIKNNTSEACLLEGWTLLIKPRQPATSLGSSSKALPQSSPSSASPLPATNGS